MLMSPCFICGRQPLSKGIDNAVTCLLLCDDVTDIVRVLFLSTVTFSPISWILCCTCLEREFIERTFLLLILHVLGMCIRVCVCVCVRERERERENVCVCVGG